MRRFAIIGVFVLLAVVFAALTKQADLWVLDPRGPIALAERNLMVTAAILMLVVVIPVFFLLAFFAWRYRDTANNRAPYTPDWEHNRFEEFVWWAVPFAIIAVLAVLTWSSSHALDPYRPLTGSAASPLEVDVIALDWKWLFIYPAQNIATVNYLEIPANTPIDLRLTADAPMNSFWIPQLSGQIMVMPGMATQLHLLAQGPGQYTGLSANYSGDGFAGMNFSVRSVSSQAFDAWFSEQRQAKAALDEQAYQQLAKPSENNPPAFYSSVASGLFASIMERYMAPVPSMHG